MRKTILTLCSSVCFFFMGMSQNSFSGKAVEESNRPLIDALVFLLGQNSAIKQIVMTDSLGRFHIDKVDFSKELIRVTAFGYGNCDLTSEVDTVAVLKPLAVQLQEVEVQAAARVEQKNDRMVFNVANTALAKASASSFELLKMAPMIEDKKDRLSILGKESAELYINGKKSNLSQEAIRSYLQSLPADRIARIEVISNPGVTNSIDANKGIINLVLKKNEADGVKGSLSLEDMQKKLNSQKGGLYLDIQKGKFNMTANVYGENSQSKNSSETDYYYTESRKHDHGTNDIKDENILAGGNVRMDYNLNKNHTLGAVVDYYYNDHTDKTDNRTDYFKALTGTELDSTYLSHTKNREQTNRVSANLNYRAQLSEQDNLSVDFDYFWNEKEHTVRNDFAREENRLEQQFDERSEETFNNYSGKAEYKHTFNDAHQLTLGVDFSYTEQDAAFTHLDWVDGQQTPDLSKNNHFDYDETLIKGYFSWNWRFGNKWMGNAGMRFENSNINGVQQATAEKISRKDFDVAPNLSVMYVPNPNHRLNYNFMTSIGRPGFYSLNPFRFYINPNTYKEYNSSLEISRTYLQSLTYSLKNKYIFGLDYGYGDNITNNFYIPVDEKYTKMINANYGNMHMVMLKFIWNQDLFNHRWFVNAAAMGIYSHSKGQVESIRINTEGVSGMFAWNNNIILSLRYNWSMNISFEYQTGIKGGAHEDGSGRFLTKASIQKRFPNDIRLNIGGNIGTFYDTRSKEYDYYSYRVKAKWDMYGAYVSVTIPFGNAKSKGAQDRGTSSSSSRLKE